MKKMYRRKEEGIASTVGTIFALMIFTALLGMFMTQVVPVTMKDNEARHDAEVLSQLSQLRSEVDILTLTKDTNYTAYVPVKLGADGIPLFASPTYGQLSLYPSKLSSNYVMNISFSDKYGNLISKVASGSLQFIAPNKYYVSELFEYANGAILRYNFDAKKAVYSINPNIRFQAVSLGSTLHLDSGDYVEIPYSSSLYIGNHITIEAWVYKNTTSSGAIFSDLSWPKCDYSFEIYNGKLYFYSDDSSGNLHSVHTTNSVVELHKWTFVAVTWDGNVVKFYKNGKLIETKNFAYNPPDVKKDFRVGRRIGGASKFVGLIDELRVLNRPLSDYEIAEDYYAGIYYPEKMGTILWYHFDNLTESGKLYDSSGNSHYGTLNGADLEERTGVNMAVTLQNIFGKPDSVTGTETRNIAIKLYGVSDEAYDLGGGILNITFSDYYRYSTSFSLDFTDYWIDYVNTTLLNIGLKYGVDYKVIPSEGKITIFGANSVNMKMVYLNFEIER